MEKFTPPTITDTTDNVLKTANAFEKNPLATALAVITFVLVGIIIWLGYQNNEQQKVNNKMVQTAFNNAIEKELQKKTIEVQSTAIDEANKKFNDSTHIYNIKSQK